MRLSSALRAATVALITLGMTSLGTAAAFADDAVPPADPAPVSAPAADPPPAAAPAPAADPPADPAPPASTDPAPVDPAPADPGPADPGDTDATPPTDPAPTSGPVVAGSPVKPQTASSRITSRSVVAPDPTPYVLLAWSLPCGVADPWCAPGQTLVHTLDLTTPSLDALDAQLIGTCNDWQVDLEFDSVTTRALIAIGVLTAPNTPPEDHAYGAVPGNPWKYVDNPTCTPTTPVTPAASATNQSCLRGAALAGGTIQLTLIVGVNYTITGPGGNVPFDGAGLATDLVPGAYSVSFTLDPGHTTGVASPIPLTITAYTGPCGVSVTPAAVGTDQGCLRNIVLSDGQIQLTVIPGVTYTITGPGGNVTYDASGLAANLTPGSYSVSFVLDPGYVTAVVSPIPITIAAYTGPCAPIPVTPAAIATPQTCAQGVFLTGGTIQLTLLTGITYTVTDSSAAVVPFDITGLASGLTPGAYSVSFLLDPTYTTAVVNPIPLFVSFYDGPCDLVTDPLVIPLVSYTPPTCTSAGSYTLANDLGIAGAVLWTVNGTPGVINGTYPAGAGTTVTIEASPLAPGFGFGLGQQTLWTHTFSLAGAVACADHLAFTGSTPQQLGWIAAILVVSGLLINRLRMRYRSRVS